MLTNAGSSSVTLNNGSYVITGLTINPSETNYLKLERVPATSGSIKLVVGLFIPEINGYTVGELFYLEKPLFIPINNTLPNAAKVFVKGFSQGFLRIIQYR
jgi:hypothetical protein